MDGGTNIWTRSIGIVGQNGVFFLIYCAAILIIGITQEYFKTTSSGTVGLVIASVILAIPAHLSVLSPLGSMEAMKELQLKNPRYMGAFFLRTLGLGAISIIPAPVVVVVCMLVLGWTDVESIALAFLAITVCGALIFAKWGTMLPAVLMQGDKTFAKAGQRGSATFFYAFPRLLLSFGLLSVVQVAAAAIAGTFFGAGENFFLGAGGLDLALVFAVLMAAAIGGYQVVMTAVILSCAYLRAETVAGSRGGLRQIESI